jgi:hypothetical protein
MRRLFFIAVIFSISLFVLTAQVPQLINYQGFLKDNNGQPLDGQVKLEFRIYSVQTGGTAMWSESRNQVEVKNGIFNVLLGSVEPFLAEIFQTPGSRFLEIVVNDNVMPKRFQITSVAYAIRSEIADDIADNKVVKSLNTLKDRVHLEDGSGISIVNTNDSTITIAATGAGGGNTLDLAYDQGGAGAGRIINADSGPVHIQRNDGLLVDGNLGIGYPSGANEKLDVNGDIRVANNLYSTDSLMLNSDTAHRLKLNDGNPGDVILARGGGNVGIGILNPARKLDINGAARMSGLQVTTGAQAGYVLTSDASGNASWQASSGGIGGSGTLNYLPKFTAGTTLGNSVLYESSGRLGIGTTVNDNYRITVNTDGTAGLGIKLHYASGSPRMLFKWDGGGADAKSWEIRAGGTFFSISTVEDNDLSLISTPLTISRTGNVGIGNIGPLYPLDITASGIANGIRVVHNGTASGTARGVYVDLANGTTTNTIYGVSSTATHDAASGAAIGVYGAATGNSPDEKYGVYGFASGEGALYAGYFYGDVEATGMITADSLLYSSARTHYYSVASEAFQPYSNIDYVNSGGNGGAYALSGSAALVTGVNLPDGATVTRFTVYFDDTSTSDMTVYLRINYFASGYGVLASVTSSGTSGYYSLSDATISNAVIDNSQYAYIIYAYSVGWSSALKIMGAVIEYTLDGAQ